MSELEDCGIDKHGYAFMTGGRMIGRAAQNAPGTPAPDIASLEKAFVSVLDWFEGTALTRHTEGPYLLGEHFSLLDVMVISSMERLAAGLPKFRGFELRSNPKYPNTAAWFEAISARPAYQKVCSDDQTLQLLFQRMMGLSSGAAAAVSSSSAAAAAGAGHGSSSSIDPDAARLDALMVGKGDYVKRMHEVVKLCKKITSAQPGPRYQPQPQEDGSYLAPLFITTFNVADDCYATWYVSTVLQNGENSRATKAKYIAQSRSGMKAKFSQAMEDQAPPAAAAAAAAVSVSPSPRKMAATLHHYSSQHTM
eukprot:GHUV01025997.1.p1 GENE.GHUV01025997.1~~GHUV01025997.1.p1  ORF type:complete len:308 (+),score=98.65 GHUV01025997.1:768-1691(+)